MAPRLTDRGAMAHHGDMTTRDDAIQGISLAVLDSALGRLADIAFFRADLGYGAAMLEQAQAQIEQARTDIFRVFVALYLDQGPVDVKNRIRRARRSIASAVVILDDIPADARTARALADVASDLETMIRKDDR